GWEEYQTAPPNDYVWNRNSARTSDSGSESNPHFGWANSFALAQAMVTKGRTKSVFSEASAVVGGTATQPDTWTTTHANPYATAGTAADYPSPNFWDIKPLLKANQSNLDTVYAVTITGAITVCWADSCGSTGPAAHSTSGITIEVAVGGNTL